MKRIARFGFPLAFAGLMLIGVGAASPQTAHAQETPPTRLTTFGIGQATAKPTRVTMVTAVSGHAPLAGDALVKFRDARRRAIEAIQALQIANLHIEGQGLALHSAYDQQTLNMLQQRMWNAEAGAAEIDTKPQIIVKEQLKITITGIDALEEAALLEMLIRLIETAQEAGLSVGGMDPAMMINHGWGNQPMSLFAFEVADPAAAQAQARAAAIAAAQARAAEMAKQAGVQLGPIISVDEYPLSANTNPYQNPMQSFVMAGVVQFDGQNLEPPPTDRLGPTTVKVRVNLSFAIAPASP